MSDAAIQAVLPTMRREGDPRLPQYVVYLHQPKGWSLQQIATALGVSREWVRVLELRGHRQIADNNRYDISGLPTYTPLKKRHKLGPLPAALPPATVRLLKAMNDDAKTYKAGHDDTTVLAFNKMVSDLINAGVPMSAIARAVGQTDRGFRRRMGRWGIASGDARQKSSKLTGRAKKLIEETAAAVVTEAPKRPCRWPDCPSHQGEPCIHPEW